LRPLRCSFEGLDAGIQLLERREEDTDTGIQRRLYE